jgi:serine/threonine-protein kinase
MLTKAWAKLLDFGLAKAQGVIASAGLSMLPTTPPNLTAQGTILGTFQYMAPEQLDGQEADARTDIFTFGAVLFEMLTGRKAFEGKSQASLIGAILHATPPSIAMTQPLAPASLDRIVATCLAKDPDDRWQSARDVMRELQWVADSGDALDGTHLDANNNRVRRGGRVALGWVLGLIVAAALGLAVGRWASSRATGAWPMTRSVIELPVGTQLSDSPAVALSPDGRNVIFAADSGGGSQLYLRAMDRLAAIPIPGTEGASQPLVSPDGQWVAFAQDGKIKKVALSGGAAQIVRDTSTFVNLAAWGADDTIVFTPFHGAGLWRISANGGSPQMLTTPSRDQHEKTHRDPEVLPGGNAMLLTVGTGDITTYDDARIEVLTLATGVRRVLIQGGMNARYVSTGHLIYARAGSLLAVPFDLNRLEVTGRPITMVEDVFTDPDSGFADFAISRDGTLVYASGGGGTHHNAALVWVDRQGHTEPAAEIRGSFDQVRLSPDGQRVAVDLDRANSDIWIYDFGRTTFTRLVYGWDNVQPVWSPDGARLTFYSDRATSVNNMFWQLADGTGAAERLMTNDSAEQSGTSWSPDGRLLVFTQTERGKRSNPEVWVWSMADRTSRPLVQTPADANQASISPDGHWVAYRSNQSGRSEVYVQAFPEPSRKWQVSLEGGSNPIWARSGRELFFRKDNQVLAADISRTSVFSAGRPKRLFEGAYVQDTWSYDVARDGRFLMIKADQKVVTHLNLVQNWFEELKARVPTK